MVETKRKRVVIPKPGSAKLGSGSAPAGNSSRRPAGISDAEMGRRMEALQAAKAREIEEAAARAAEEKAREVRSFMSDSDGKKTLSLRGRTRPGNVKQSFSHGRTKSVVLKTKRKRLVIPAGISDAEMKALLTDILFNTHEDALDFKPEQRSDLQLESDECRVLRDADEHDGFLLDVLADRRGRYSIVSPWIIPRALEEPGC